MKHQRQSQLNICKNNDLSTSFLPQSRVISCLLGVTRGYAIFLPLLIIYLLVVLLHSSHTLTGDEGRYILYANNLLHGYYSAPPPNIHLWSGPGYPLFLAPFVCFVKSYLFLRILNALLFFISVVLFNKITRLLLISNKNGLLVTYLYGLYYPILLTVMPYIVSEVFTIFLVVFFSYSVVNLWKNNAFRYILLSSISLALIALTKVIFGYVIILLLICSLLIYYGFKRTAYARNLIAVFALSILFCAPYLYYTYNLTGKIFYWGNSGGISLYWMSTPFKNEYGNWYGGIFIKDEPYYSTFLERNHGEFFKEINKFKDNPIKQDELFKKKAIENIQKHPFKFISNIAANIGRIFFHYPFSYNNQTLNTYFILVPNMFIVCLGIPLGIVTLKKLIKMNSPLLILLMISFIYLACSSLLSAYMRMFFIILPIILIWFGYMFDQVIDIRIK